MAELDVALRQLGREIELPPTPDIASAVRSRLERPRRWRRPVAIALIVIAFTVGAVLAVPPARTAVLEWLGLSSVRIVRVNELPPTPATERLELGRQISLERAPQWVLVPDDDPDSVHVDGGRVSLLWGTREDVRLLLTEFRGMAFIEKLVDLGADVETVRVDGKPGVWLEEPHVVFFDDLRGRVRRDKGRLAGKTLLWQHGEVTLRLEGEFSKEEALRIARSAD